MIAQAKQRLVFLLGFLFASLPGIALADSDSVIVDCARGRSIQDALGKKNPDRPLEVVIRGACAEDVTISRDDVTLVGEGGTVNGTISIIGARRVLIRSLTVSSPTGAGISGTDNAAFTVEDSTLERNGSDGIQVRHGAHAKILRNRIAENGQASLPDSGRGIYVHDAGSAEVRGNAVLNNRSDGVGVFNDSYVRLVENAIEGNGRFAAQEAGVQVSRARIRAHGNTIRNNTGLFGLEIVNGSSYRTGSFLTAADFLDNEFPFEVIEHPVGAGRLAIEVATGSYGDFRQVHIVGSVSVGDHSMVQIRGDQIAPNMPCATVNATGGFVFVSGRFGLLRLRAVNVTPPAIGVGAPFGLLDGGTVCP